MSRETKKKSEAEAVILKHLKEMPGGKSVEIVTIHVGDDEAEDPSVRFSVGWVGHNDMREMNREASRLHGRLRREFRLVAD